ncbi:MAG: XRE family transcriptional regulator [Prevotellaceae bacterium]|jgi:quercetin dioxygenase-like cupin family protein/DNA-binding Xre family transcriptional regulator|nr:XRE family transcriptional regulator [Prevotellaceae bacterium]
MSDSTIVGKKIKSIRESKNISLDELSERSGLTTAQITSIEESENLPSLAPLIKIARVLGVRLGTFLDDNDALGPVVSRKETKKESISFSGGATNARTHMEYFSLAGHKSGRHIEPFVIDILPDKENKFTLSAHEGEEFIYVLEGEVEISYGKDVYTLAQGDSIFYDSIVEHHVHAKDGKAAKILAVVYAPF